MGLCGLLPYIGGVRVQEIPLTGMTLPQAAAVLDLALAGVHSELGEVPFDWRGSTKVAEVTVLNVPQREKPKPVATQAIKTEVKPAPKAAEAGRVWRAGEEGGVVLVVQGDENLVRACEALARRMLTAAGYGDMPLAWVGMDGVVSTEVLKAGIEAEKAQRILLLGQNILEVLQGRALGVEGWHAKGGGEVAGLSVGVTYPLELLMKQPLFKRLAWQHLLAWREAA